MSNIDITLLHRAIDLRSLSTELPAGKYEITEVKTKVILLA